MPSSGPFKDLTGYLVYCLFVSTLGPLLFGYHLAELNAPQDVITCVKAVSSKLYPSITNYFPGSHAEDLTAAAAGSLPQCIPMTTAQFGLVSSFFTLGGLLGALSAGPLSARFGRLKTMLWTTTPFIVGGLMEAVSPNVAVLTIGRFMSGLGAGAAVVVVPLYISETAPPKEKGFFGTFTQVMINVGILIAQILGFFFSRGQMWRIILGVAGAIALAQAVALALTGQESPKWLADNGKPSKAKRALRRLRGHTVDIDEEVEGWNLDTEQDLEDEEEALLANEDNPRGRASDSNATNSTHHHDSAAEEVACGAKQTGKSVKRQTIGVLGVLRHPESQPGVIAVIMVMLAQQLCGINSIVMYGVSLLADLLASNSSILNILVAVLNIVTTLIAAPLVDKLGRKSCLLLSIGGMGINSVLLGVGIMRHIPTLSAVAALLFVASFGLGLGPVPFILSSELVGAEAVGATQSWALAANWIATFVVAQFFPIVNDALGKGQVYFIFAAFALFFGAFVVWWVPETKGKANADEVWGRGKSADRQD